MQVLLSTLLCSLPPSETIHQVSLLSPKILLSFTHSQVYTTRHSVVFSPYLPPHLTLPRMFQSNRKRYVFSGFGVAHSFLPVSTLPDLKVVHRPSSIPIQVDLDLPRLPPKLEQWSLVHCLPRQCESPISPQSSSPHPFARGQYLPTYPTCLHTYSIVVSFRNTFAKDSC